MTDCLKTNRTSVRSSVRWCPVDTNGLNRTDTPTPLGVVSGGPVSGPESQEANE